MWFPSRSRPPASCVREIHFFCQKQRQSKVTGPQSWLGSKIMIRISFARKKEYFWIHLRPSAKSREIPRNPAKEKTVQNVPSAKSREIPRNPADCFLAFWSLFEVQSGHHYRSGHFSWVRRWMCGTSKNFVQMLWEKRDLNRLWPHLVEVVQECAQDVALRAFVTYIIFFLSPQRK